MQEEIRPAEPHDRQCDSLSAPTERLGRDIQARTSACARCCDLYPAGEPHATDCLRSGRARARTRASRRRPAPRGRLRHRPDVPPQSMLRQRFRSHSPSVRRQSRVSAAGCPLPLRDRSRPRVPSTQAGRPHCAIRARYPASRASRVRRLHRDWPGARANPRWRPAPENAAPERQYPRAARAKAGDGSARH